MKLLYDEEGAEKARERANQLQCSKYYERLHELHNQTINMWKMILYWRKRREMCYTTPFLDLDMMKVLRSIEKTTRYFETKMDKHKTVR